MFKRLLSALALIIMHSSAMNVCLDYALYSGASADVMDGT